MKRCELAADVELKRGGSLRPCQGNGRPRSWLDCSERAHKATMESLQLEAYQSFLRSVVGDAQRPSFLVMGACHLPVSIVLSRGSGYGGFKHEPLSRVDKAGF